MKKIILLLLLLLSLGIATARTVVIDEISSTLTNDLWISDATPTFNVTVCCDAATYTIRAYYNNETTPLNLSLTAGSVANNTNTQITINNTLSQGIMRLNIYATSTTTDMSVVARRYIDSTSPVVTKIYIPARADNLTNRADKYTFSCSVTETNLNSAWINSTITKKALTCSSGTCTGEYNLSAHATGLNLSTGANDLTCCVNDSAANYHCLGMSVTYDSTKPLIGENTSISSTYVYLENYGQVVNITFYASDTNLNWSDCYISSTKALNATGTTSTAFSLTNATSNLFDLDGNCTYTAFDIYCRDKAGNLGNFSIENLTIIPCVENWNSTNTYTVVSTADTLIVTGNQTGAVTITAWMKPVVGVGGGTNRTCPYIATNSLYSSANITVNITGSEYCVVTVVKNASDNRETTISKFSPGEQKPPDLLLPAGVATILIGLAFIAGRITKKKQN